MAILRFFIYSNLLVSISAGMLAFACATKLGNPHYVGIGWLVFMATLFIYNFQRILRIKEIKVQKSNRHIWIEKHQLLIKSLSLIGLFGCVIIYFAILGWNVDFWLLAIGALIGVLYVLQIHPKTMALRNIPYIKIYLIVLQWTLAVIVWPYIRISNQIEFPLIFSLSIFFFILAATIPFDIRDLVYDSRYKSTIPQVFGIQGAKTLAILFLLLSGLFLSFEFENNISNPLFYFVYSVLALLIVYSKKTNPEMYFSGIIDGSIILYGVLIYLS